MTIEAVLAGVLILASPLQRTGAAAYSSSRSIPGWERTLPDQDLTFVRAYQAYKRGRYSETLRSLQFLLEDRSYWLRDYTLHLAARSRERLGQWQEAVETYKELLDEYPDFPLARAHRAAMANAYYQSGNYKQADPIYHSLLGDDNEQKPLYFYRLFRIHLSAGHESALPIFLDLYRGFPHRSEADQAWSEVQRNKPLLKEFRSRWTLRDSIARVDVLVREEQYSKALSEIRTLNQRGGLDPSQKKYLDLKLGQIYLAQEKSDAAIQAFQRLVSVDFLEAEAQLGLARAYIQKKWYERAHGLLRELLEHPATGELKARAAEALVQSLKKRPDASDELGPMYLRLAQDPDVSNRRTEYRWRAALEQLNGGEYYPARELLLQIKTPGENWWQAPAAVYWLGRLSEWMGDRNMAHYFYQEVLQNYPLSYYAYLIEQVVGDSRIAKVSGPERPSFARSAMRGASAEDSCYLNKSPAATRYLDRASRMARIGLEELARMELQGLLESKNDPSAVYLAYQELVGIKQYATVISDGRRRFSVPLQPSMLPCDEIWPLLYPRGYRQFVSYMAEKEKVDPNLLYALIRQESTFNPKITSSANARGLMQLIPSTARIVQNQTGMTFMNKEDLFDPYFNVKLGVTHFKDLLDQYDGSVILALAAYNAGPGNVKRWMAERTYRDDAEFAEFIPYRETHDYVKKVLSSYQVYSWLYKDEPPVVSYD
ncbi:MAG: transglycosylase SLT domain-containing protein [Nitrospirae bacterium]|nr:transglycosylase SLT domain-containing protein [Nitrospirota bacterium]